MESITPKKLATILAALRLWQCELNTDTDDRVCFGDDMSVLKGTGHFQEEDPLTPEEIDELCEALNLGEYVDCGDFIKAAKAAGFGTDKPIEGSTAVDLINEHFFNK
jgi:hypothetical protein